ncbi:hypothetical protein AMATHDRAFT_142510 [Amanita thiersii Skay4041]|uniref:Uncharacterized protein n=1 Tax=Amanita thiersii Skay4041 TaxID=703135 RepID=A0A2A9NTC4_9AGAR|nr:hypothetical protein AMATHDRAFT_142510 [Amanita thiersii Skay4041]
MQRRTHSTNGTNKHTSTNGHAKDHQHDRLDSYEHEKDHMVHSHMPFRHSHSHGDDGNGHSHSHSHGTENLVAAFEGAADKGSQITLIGLFSNVALTGAKGLAGWYMHSASLLADAGHSLSDLLGDFVTLFCWRYSRGRATERYPYGFAKFETLGTVTISLLLIGGAVGIGFHSFHLLVAALHETAETLQPGFLQQFLHALTALSLHLPVLGHVHAHTHAVDPNAAWFAAVSVLVKEWLYRITKKVADEERSPVLLANAIHHRSDAYSSLVAFFAILGTWLYPKLPLDPIGGLLVSFVILRQGVDLLADAWKDLTDASVSPRTLKSLYRSLQPLLAKSSSSSSIPELLDVQDLRARRAGSLMFVDLSVHVPATLTVQQTSILQEKVTATLKDAKKEIADVRIKFEPVNSDGF